MNPHYPGYTPSPPPPGHADHARLPGIAGLCFAVALLVAYTIASFLVVQVGVVLAFGLPALLLSAFSFRRPGQRFWAGTAFVIMMATPVVSALIDYVGIINQIE